MENKLLINLIESDDRFYISKNGERRPILCATDWRLKKAAEEGWKIEKFDDHETYQIGYDRVSNIYDNVKIRYIVKNKYFYELIYLVK